MRSERRGQRDHQRPRRRARRRAAPNCRFAAIWSNPPIRIGKPALHELLTRWLGRLTPDGVAHLVVHKHLGADSLQRWLTDDAGHHAERISTSGGYRILRIDAHA